MQEKFIKKYVRIKKSLNDKINQIQKEINETYSYETLSYILELGILKHEELKVEANNNTEINFKLDKIISMLEDFNND